MSGKNTAETGATGATGLTGPAMSSGITSETFEQQIARRVAALESGQDVLISQHAALDSAGSDLAGRVSGLSSVLDGYRKKVSDLADKVTEIEAEMPTIVAAMERGGKSSEAVAGIVGAMESGAMEKTREEWEKIKADVANLLHRARGW